MNDIFGISGLLMMSAGVYSLFGWEIACIIAGTLFLAIAITGAMRR